MLRKMLCLSVVVSAFSLLGCGAGSGPAVHDGTGPDAHQHAHAHAGHGPHGGDIVELGSDQYHAELVHDDATGGVTIYVLDATAKRAAPIDAELVRVNVQHDGNAEQFTLSASPEENDPEGTSSRFITPERELAEDLDHGDIRGQLVVMISGKQYRGDVVHDHHGHDHDDHHDHHDHGHDHHDHGAE